MQRVIRGAGWLFIAIALLLAVDYFRVRAKERRVFAAVSQLGGQMGSIPAWPIGTEYRISFTRSLTLEDIDKLQELNDLRGWVGLRFVGCDLTDDERHMIGEKLARCHVIDERAGRNAAPQP